MITLLRLLARVLVAFVLLPLLLRFLSRLLFLQKRLRSPKRVDVARLLLLRALLLSQELVVLLLRFTFRAVVPTLDITQLHYLFLFLLFLCLLFPSRAFLARHRDLTNLSFPFSLIAFDVFVLLTFKVAHIVFLQYPQLDIAQRLHELADENLVPEINVGIQGGGFS